eukprot:3393051-Pleurochrysis_carterae.AAC.1
MLWEEEEEEELAALAASQAAAQLVLDAEEMEWCEMEQCCVAPGGRTDFSSKRPRRGNLAST